MPTEQLRLLPRGRRPLGRARRGLDETIAAWRSAGAVEQADAAWLSLARVTADALDAAERDTDESRFVLAALAARHRDVLVALYDRHAADAGPSLGELLAALDNPADTEPT